MKKIECKLLAVQHVASLCKVAEPVLYSWIKKGIVPKRLWVKTGVRQIRFRDEKGLAQLILKARSKTKKLRRRRSPKGVKVISLCNYTAAVLVDSVLNFKLDWIEVLEMMAACEREGLEAGDLKIEQARFVGRLVIYRGQRIDQHSILPTDLKEKWPSTYAIRGRLCQGLPSAEKVLSFFGIVSNRKRFAAKQDDLLRSGVERGLPHPKALQGVVPPVCIKAPPKKILILAAVLRCSRKIKKITQAEVAHEMGISASALTQWLKKPELADAYALALEQIGANRSMDLQVAHGPIRTDGFGIAEYFAGLNDCPDPEVQKELVYDAIGR